MNNIKETLDRLKNLQGIQGTRQIFMEELNEENLVIFSQKIKEGKFLPEIHLCKHDEKFKSFWLPVLYYLFNKEEIGKWFQNCMYRLYKEQSQKEWKIPNSLEYYSQILGISYLNRDLGIPVKLDLTFLANIFNDFKVKYTYPDYLVDLFKETIRARKPFLKILEENSHIFKSNKSYTFYKLLEFCVIPDIGFEEVKSYFSDMINLFKDENTIDPSQPIALDSFSYFLAGKRHSFSFNKIRKEKPEPKLFLKALYQALLPELLKKTFPSRHQVYEYLELNESQIQECEEYYQKNLINGVHYNSGHFNQIHLKDISTETLSTFKALIKKEMEYYKSKRIIPKVAEVFNAIITQLTEESLLSEIYQHRNLINNLIVESCHNLKTFFYETRIESLDFEEDFWRVYFKIGDSIHYRNFDFTLLKSPKLREELKAVLRFKVTHNINLKPLGGFIEKVSLIENRFKINSFKEIDTSMLSTVYHYLEVKRNLSISSISSFNTELKKVFNILMELREEYQVFSCPPDEITFHNKRNHSTKTKVIPENVLEEINRFSYELPEAIRLAFKLFIQTGWRFGEIKNLKIEDFKPSSEFTNLTEITINITKTKKQRKSNGFNEFHSGFITNKLYKEILSYLNKTQPVRQQYHINWLLFSLDKGKAQKLNSPRFNIYLNDLIQRHQICGPDGKIWHFSSRQTRKTVITSLIKDGASRSCVQKVCGHLRSETTETYYIEVQKERLASINLEFFKSVIESHLSIETSDSEKKDLTQFFLQLSNSLELEYGVCLKPVNERLCPQLTEPGCSNCHNMCTGRIYRKGWISLLESTEKLIESIISIYQHNNIPESEYRKYEEFKYLNNRYQRIKEIVKELNEVEKTA